MEYGIDDLKQMDHHDIDDDFWKKPVTKKAYHKKVEKQPESSQMSRRSKKRKN